ncbi:SsrA-binding protein SmpB [Cytophagaceae bacterium ABcell3]|nr:SsrA-binding protein SmpB [Cytophagaceae bacterium ABcell3]
MAGDKKIQKTVNIRNKKASFEYHFVDVYVAGIALTGTEIKSIRQGKVNIQDGFCYFKGEELYVKNMHISKYEEGTHFNHDPLRERKLLLKKKELRKLFEKSQEKGLTIILVRLFINDRGLAKLEIALAKGKKLYDKREDIKQKDIKREMDRMKY